MIKSGKPTIRDLAEKAGVSKTAVSFAFNSPERISTETYKKIMKIAQELGYSPDPVARILAKRRTQSLALLLPQSIPQVFQNPYITEILRGFGDVCDREGFSVLVLSPVKGIISHAILNSATDGIAILGVTSASEVHTVCKQRDMPYVTIDADNSSDYVNIGIDEELASEELATILLEKGHRRICVCTLPSVSSTLIDDGSSETLNARTKGILNAVNKYCEKIPDDLEFIEIDSAYNKAYEPAMKILSRKNRPTAIYCMADIQAYGFYSAARNLDLSIPGDVSIVTFDNLPHTDILDPRPTAVKQPGFEKGKIAAEFLIAMMNNKKCHSMVLEHSIFETDSVSIAEGN